MANGKHDRRTARPGQRRGESGARAPRPPSPRRHRTDPGALWLFGTHAVAAAVANPRRTVRRILVSGEGPAGGDGIPVVPGSAAPAPVRVSRQEIESLLPEGAVHQGIAAEVLPLPELAVEDICAACAGQPRAALVVLDKVTDPRNVGAILRSVAAFGGTAIVVPDRGAPIESGTLAKAASGALERVPIVRAVNLKRALEIMKRHGIWCVGLDAGAETTLPAAPVEGRVALVLGAEGTGLRRLTRETCDLIVKIPIASEVESLNVSTATAVALYEWARRN